MQIKSIKISNIFSFEYKENIDDCQEITFDMAGLNLLVGENGGGKTNFIEIINHLFHVFIFKQYSFSEDSINLDHPNGYPIKKSHLSSNSLIKNYYSISDKKSIKIKLSLDKYDLKIINFILNQKDELNSIIQKKGNLIHRHRKYCAQDIGGITNHNINQQITDVTELELLFSFSESSDPINLSNNKMNFIYYEYLLKYNLIQHLVYIGNKYENKQWDVIQDRIYVVGNCDKNYNLFESLFTNNNLNAVNGIILRKAQRNFKTSVIGGEPTIFTTTKYKIYEDFTYLHTNKYPIKEALLRKNEIDLFKKVNDLLEELIPGLKFNFDRHSDKQLEIKFWFTLNDRIIENINELSVGQKEIINLVFTLLSINQSGIIFIDGLEVELHPQLQKKIIKIINKISKDKGIQFIASTHSSIFINPDTISNVHRFYLKNNFTKVANVKDDRIKELTRLLSYTNSSKMFFAKKVILVEGVTDEYFYGLFLDWLHENDKDFQKYHNEVGTIEILDIGGKGDYKLWKDFLEKYNIAHFYIGDWDNVVNFNLLSTEKINSIKASHLLENCKNIDKKVIKDKKSRDSKFLSEALFKYINNRTERNFENLKTLFSKIFLRHIPTGKSLIEIIKKEDSALFKKIKTKIKAKYEEKIYLLEKGELEDYLNEGDIFKSFLSKEAFKNWKKDKKYHFQEIKNILLSIIKHS